MRVPHWLYAMIFLVAAASPAFAQYTLTTRASFDGADGLNPEAGLVLSGGTLYGTTTYGGASYSNSSNGYGEVFSLPSTGGPLNLVGSFNGGTTQFVLGNGGNPESDLTLSGGPNPRRRACSPPARCFWSVAAHTCQTGYRLRK